LPGEAARSSAQVVSSLATRWRMSLRVVVSPALASVARQNTHPSVL
jgi:hypothetical protein